mmetsp:Transcript_135/g.486  ORF Transcript_135/g.486 Transcript_135/m.486 type:complete len:144 (-) Transcript_135:708-1139(-)|eukprot:scaffold220963_cov30-Tisochrysis_lutea.AAC.1
MPRSLPFSSLEASSRRNVLLGVGAMLTTAPASLLAAPHAAQASYAMYAASQKSFEERKADKNWKPVATSDRETLAQIQADIAKKRPRSERLAKKPPQYCAGQMSMVSPMMENMCANIGTSKADQANTKLDSYGNMNVGEFGRR